MEHSDDPMQKPFQSAGLAMSQRDLTTAWQSYYYRSMSGTAYVFSVPLGALLVFMFALWLPAVLHGPMTIVGAVAAPCLLWFQSHRRARRYAIADAEAQHKAWLDKETETQRQIKDARARGDFDQWN